MDEIVEAALRKWPDVPHCYGWLALDARGNWTMRDERTQAAGPFPQVKGSRVEHAKLLGFIERNYGCDDRGAWFFQNGPQRVFVELEATPWIWRVADDGTLASHTGKPAEATSSWLDQHGRLYAATDIGFGLVHSLDVAIAARAIDSGTWRPQSVDAEALPARFGYVLRPTPG